MTEAIKDIVNWWKHAKWVASFFILFGMLIGAIIGESLIVVINGGSPLIFQFTMEVGHKAKELITDQNKPKS